MLQEISENVMWTLPEAVATRNKADVYLNLQMFILTLPVPIPDEEKKLS